MKTMHPTIVNSNLSLPGNDSKHNKPDFNRGGGPNLMNRKKVPPKSRGGFGHHGQQRIIKAPVSGGGKSGAGNPASRGGTPRSFHPDTRNPDHGGAVQARDNMDTVTGRGGFGNTGQSGVPTMASNPQPGTGNTGGRMSTRVSGHFTNKTKGSKAGAGTRAAGKWGGPPVRLDS